MGGLVLLRLLPHTGRQGWRDADRGPGCTGGRAPSAMPVADHWEDARLSSPTVSARCHGGPEPPGGASVASGGRRGPQTRPPSAPGPSAGRVRRGRSPLYDRRGPHRGVTAAPAPTPAALARPGEQAVALRAPGLAPRCCARHPFLRPREERVPPAEAEAGPRAHGPQTPGRAVDALDADRPDPIRRLLLRRRAWPPAIGRRKGRGTGRGGRAARPAHPARDHRGQSPPGRAPRAVRRIGQARDGQWEPPPGQHAPQPGLPQRPPQTIPHHGRALGAPRAPRHTQPPHAWPTAPHGRPPVASSASARRKAAGLCTRLDPGSSGGARW